MKRFSRALFLLLMLTLLFSLPALAADPGMGNFQKTVVYTPFTDVPADAWYAEDVKTAVELGLMNGKGGGVFDPNGRLTLAEAITIAVKIDAIYSGNEFTPGGTPWYANAVEYGLAHNIVFPGEFTNYNQPADRSSMAGIFGSTIPPIELPRINRIAHIPDITTDTAYVNYIYYLYYAGVLTGGTGGSFRPNDGISRAEVAAIVNRVVLPANRKSITLNQSPSWGETVTSKDGGFRINVPTGWDWGEDDTFGFWCSVGGDAVSLQVLPYSKKEYPNSDPGSTAVRYLKDRVIPQLGEDAIRATPTLTLCRGLTAMTFQFDGPAADGAWTGTTAYVVENSTANYIILLNSHGDQTDEQWTQLLEVLYSFDLAL